MSIWNAVQNIGQTIQDAAHSAMDALDSAVKFVSELPPSRTPDAIYEASDRCDWRTLGLESKEVQDRCFERLNRSFHNSRISSMTYETQSETEPQSPLSSAVHRILSRPNPLVKTVNVANRAPDLEACVPWFLGGDSGCMDDFDEWLPVLGVGTIVALGIAGVSAATSATTKTIITESNVVLLDF
jgi:hypothetical protein